MQRAVRSIKGALMRPFFILHLQWSGRRTTVK